jgi:hypothetical protein
MSRSIYGGSGKPKAIYGLNKNAFCPKICDCVAEPDPIISILTLNTILTVLKESVAKFFPPALVRAPFSAPLITKAGIPATHLLRMKWIRDHPGEQFNKNNVQHRFQLMDLYLINGLDWKKDPLFK